MSELLHNPINLFLLVLAGFLILAGMQIRRGARALPTAEQQRRRRLAAPLLGCGAFILLIPLWTIGAMVLTYAGVLAVCKSGSHAIC